MGKNKKGKGQAQKQNKNQQNEVSVGTDPHNEDNNHQEQQEPQISPEEKARQYKEMQLQVFNNFIKDFQEEEKSLKEEPNFTDKQKEIEKREKDEMKKLEKQFKKDQQEVEEQFANGNLAGLRDRILKSISEINKQNAKLKSIQNSHNNTDGSLNKIKNEIQSSMKKKDMLYSLCMSLLDKNHDLFLKHEKMLEEERQERQNLAVNFQEQMKEVTQELEVQKQKRTAEINENQEIRAMIQQAITDYKKKEEGYRSKMDSHGKVIQEIEKKLKQTIEGTITKTLKEAENEKQRYLKSCENVKELSTKINGYMEKFDRIKEEMSENGKKFENYQSAVETKKIEIQTLETEIENITLSEKRFQKQSAEIAEDRKRMTAQVDTMKNLRNALKEQLRNLTDSNKENQTSVAN